MDAVSAVACGSPAERHRLSSSSYASQMRPTIQDAQDTPTSVFVTLRTRAFHRDHRDQLASFPTLGTRVQTALHLQPQGSQRTARVAARPLETLPILSRMYPARLALKLTSPRNNNFA